MADRTVSVSLQAQVTGYLQGMDKAAKATANAGTAAEKAARQVEQQNQAMQSAGKGLMAIGAVAVVATALSVKAAIGWQSAWAGVTKTVEGTPAELAKVEEGLRSLAKTLPSSHDEIAAVAEAAGQLGIKTASVTAFTKTMIDLGETTNLSADEAATSLARFMNVMGTSQDDVGRLGSAIVELGNNYATTEAEIVAMSMRLAGAGRQVGLSEGEVLGLATALSSVGIEAEAGGSAISKVMIQIAASVEEGGADLDLFAKTSGVSAKDFADQWKSEPSAALALFVQGLGDAEEQGGSTLQVLADLGIKEVRMRDALLRSAAASDQFTAAMDTGNQAMIDNNALAEEAAKRYATVESQLEITKNKVIDASISFGQVFLPAVEAASNAVGGIADALGAMDPTMQGVVAAGVLLTGGIALVGGAALVALPKIAAFQVSLGILATSSMPAVAAAATGMMTATTRATASMSAGAKFLTGPWGIALAAAATAALLAKSAIDDWNASAEEIANSLKTAASAQDLLNASSKGVRSSWIVDATAELGDLNAVLESGAHRAESFTGFLDLYMGEHAALGVIGDIGKEIAKVTATDLPEAQRQFRLLAKDVDDNEQSQWRLLASMPELKDALVSQASALDINVTSTDEAANKTKLLELAFGDATPVALSAAEAYLETADQASALDDEILTLMDSMNELNGVGQDASGANIAYQQSLADLDAQIAEINAGTEGYIRTLDITTEAGRENRGMLDDLAASSQNAAAKQFGLDGNTANYKATLERGHQAVVDRAIALGANADEANRIADEISKIPSESEWTVIAKTEAAESKLQGLLNKFSNRTVEVGVYGNGLGVLKVPGAATGGTIRGPGTGTSDSIPTMLSNGEEVIRASMADKFRPLLKAINADRVPGYATGGTVGYATTPQYVPQSQSGFASQSAAPITVMVASKGGVDLLKYVDVTVQQAGVVAGQVRDAQFRRG